MRTFIVSLVIVFLLTSCAKPIPYADPKDAPQVTQYPVQWVKPSPEDGALSFKSEKIVPVAPRCDRVLPRAPKDEC